MSFGKLGLSEELLRSVSEAAYTRPTPIQAQAIPAILQGKDVMAAAQTGTGKTAAFGLPIIQLTDNKNKDIECVILCFSFIGMITTR